MNKKNNNKGFTLAELLIVVAIIAVLVAIAIPVFTTQLEKSREATDAANIRSAYAEAMAAYLTDGTGSEVRIPQKQARANWEYIDGAIKSGEGKGKLIMGTKISSKGSSATGSAATTGQVEVDAAKDGNNNEFILTVDNKGDVKVECKAKT